MLNTPAPFPLAGSYAFYVHQGKSVLVRIVKRDPPATPEPEALIAFVGTAHASGNRNVPIAALIDGTPLTADEAAEQLALMQKLLAAKRPKKADRARFDALRTRAIYARLIDEALRERGLERLAA